MKKEKCIHDKIGRGCSLLENSECSNCSFYKTKWQMIKLRYCIEHNEAKNGTPDEANRKLLKEYL